MGKDKTKILIAFMYFQDNSYTYFISSVSFATETPAIEYNQVVILKVKGIKKGVNVL